MNSGGKRGEMDESEVAAAVLRAIASVLADKGGSIDAAIALQHLACITGWLISGYPKRDRQAMLDHYAGLVVTRLGDNGEASGFTEFLLVSVH